MNTKILQKCLDELNKEPFKIDKVIGMLETMIEMANEQQAQIPYFPTMPQPVPMPNFPVVVSATNEPIPVEHSTIEDAYLRGGIATSGLQ
jgi:hypothetical protein